MSISSGASFEVEFNAPSLGLYLEDSAEYKQAAIGEQQKPPSMHHVHVVAIWPWAPDVQLVRLEPLADKLLDSNKIGRFNPSETPDGAGPGEAEMCGRLNLGDLISSVHGVDVRSFPAEEVAKLVCGDCSAATCPPPRYPQRTCWQLKIITPPCLLRHMQWLRGLSR